MKNRLTHRGDHAGPGAGHGRRALAATIATAALLTGTLAAHGQYRPDRLPEGPPVATPNPEIVERRGAQVPLDLEFTRSDGVQVKLADVFAGNRPVILVMVYFSCPSLCGFNQEALVYTVREGPRSLRLGVDYDILVVSIDPDDTPAQAAAKRGTYLSMMDRPESQAGFTYLTGNQENIRRLADTVGFGFKRNFVGGDKFLHSAGIFICTGQGRLSQTILGINFPSDTVHYALRQAADGKIGSGFMDSVALACGAVRFNERTGRYEHNPYFWAGTAGGVATIVAMGLFLGFMWRGEWKQRRHSTETPEADPAQDPGDAEN